MTFKRQLSKTYIAFNVIWLLLGSLVFIIDEVKFFIIPAVIYPFGFFLLDGVFGKYVLNDNELIVNQIFSKTKIDWSAVRKVEVKKQNWFLRFMRGITDHTLVLHYNKYDEIFLNPVEEKLFIKQLKEKSPEVEVIYP
jgi:hypothetical protein